MKKKMNNIELFAGAGGLALGLDQAGFNTIGLIEIDKDACETLRINRPDWKIIQEDITKLTEKDLPSFFGIEKGKLDLLSGGFPCQSFSYAGQRKGLEDTRGTLFYYFAKFLEKLQPRMFLAENVKGLVRHDNGKTLGTMLSVFQSMGYEVTYKVLNAWDYQTPQKRERIFMIGKRNDLGNEITYDFPEKITPKLVLRDVLVNVPSSPGISYGEKKKAIMNLIPPGGCWVDLPIELQKSYLKNSYFLGGGKRGIARRMSFDEPSLTLTCSPAMKQTERCHPIETRPFTTREYARIQTFHDEWKFAGNTMSIYKQIGNAVPVKLAYHVGVSLVKSLGIK